MNQKPYDLIIIGGGSAGLASGLYAGRSNLNALLLEKTMTGGLTATTHLIENYPGFDHIDGPTLMGKFKDQALKFGLQIKEFGEVIVVKLKDKLKEITVKGFDGESTYLSKTVIIATGSTPRHLSLPNEEKLLGRGLSYCATCDGAFFRDQKVAVIGGGDSAVKEALFLTRFASEVTIVHRRDEFRAEKVNLEKAKSDPKIKLKTPFVVQDLLEDEKGDFIGLNLKNTQSGEVEKKGFDGVFVYIGHLPNTQFLEKEMNLENGHIKVDLNMKTELPGVWAVGDVRVESKRQVATGSGDGVTASIDAEEWLEHNS